MLLRWGFDGKPLQAMTSDRWLVGYHPLLASSFPLDTNCQRPHATLPGSGARVSKRKVADAYLPFLIQWFPVGSGECTQFD